MTSRNQREGLYYGKMPVFGSPQPKTVYTVYTVYTKARDTRTHDKALSLNARAKAQRSVQSAYKDCWE